MRKIKNQQLRLPTISSTVNLDIEAISLALFGSIYPDQRAFYSGHMFPVRVDLQLGYKNFWLEQLEQFENSLLASPINLTSYGVRPKKVVGLDILFESDTPNIVFVDSLNALLLFWNIRAHRESITHDKAFANGRRVLILPSQLTRNKKSIDTLFQILKDKYPVTKSNLKIAFVAWNKASIRKLKNLISKFEYLQKFEGNLKISFISQNDQKQSESDKSQELTYVISPMLSLPDKYLEGVGQTLPTSTILNRGNNELQYEPPAELHNPHAEAVSFDLESEIFNHLPECRKVAEVINPNGWFSRYGFSYVATVSQFPHYVNFNLPSEQEAINLYFESHGYKSRYSKVTNYSKAVINLLGGVKGVSHIESRPAYELLNILCLKSTKKIAQRIGKVITGRSSEEIESILKEFESNIELKGITRSYSQLSSDKRISLSPEELLTLLNKLSNTSILVRGYYVECPNCGFTDWYPIDLLSEKLRCVGCSYEFHLPVKENSKQELQWRYRLNSLVNRAVDQDIIPAILAVHQIARNNSISCVNFGIELLKSNNPIAEFDFLCVKNRRMIGGECKSGTKLTKKDYDLALLASNMGFSNFLFCTPENFDDTTKERVERLKSKISKSNLIQKYIFWRETNYFLKSHLTF